MSTVYAWLIEQLDCYPAHEGRSNVVFTVHWRRRATSVLHTAEVYGTQSLTLDPSAPFTPFNDLTPATVESWLEAAMGAEFVASLDASLDKEIARQISPPVVAPPLPWV